VALGLGGIHRAVDLGTIRIDQGARNLVIDQYQNVQRLDVFDLQGRAMIRVAALTRSTLDLAEVHTVVFLCQLHAERGVVVKRLFLE